jgi:hypothetical protein
MSTTTTITHPDGTTIGVTTDGAPAGPPGCCSYLETIGQTPMVRLDRVLPAASQQAVVLRDANSGGPGGGRPAPLA